MPDEPSDKPLFEVRDLAVVFGRKGEIRAVDGVSFDLGAGQTLGLVGESGSGKTTVGRAILRLTTAAAGTVRFDGHDVLHAGAAELRQLRRQMQIVFQDPAGSLNPRMRIRDIIAEPLPVHGIVPAGGIGDEVLALLER